MYSLRLTQGRFKTREGVELLNLFSITIAFRGLALGVDYVSFVVVVVLL